MPDTLEDGDSVDYEGSSSTYTLKRIGVVYSCSCPAWRNQSTQIDKRTCKHLRAYLGDAAETLRIGTALTSPAKPSRSSSGSSSGSSQGSVSGSSTGGGAPPVLLAHKWENAHDPTGWWMSEKLDGIRAYWDGEAFVSRLGNKFFAPDWFIADLPADTLDGELWVGRKMFQKTTSIVRSMGADQQWRQLTYVVFDAPNAKGGFEDRIAHATKVLTKAGAPHARCLDHVECKGIAHLKEELARVESLGGEGLMLRQPKSRYVVGRSTTLLKVKTFHDSEARVIGHAPGSGKHKGRLGALIVELADGTKFNVGTGLSDAERDDPPKVGTVITFRYQELSNDGVPRFPSYVGERVDVAMPAPTTKGGKPAASKGAASKAVSSKSAVPTPPSAATPAAGKPPPDYFVRLEHPTENKFWEIEVRGASHFTRYGKIGSTGQTKLTEIGTLSAAKSDAEKRAIAKRKEGYLTITASSG